jgi:hypothetical protein
MIISCLIEVSLDGVQEEMQNLGNICIEELLNIPESKLLNSAISTQAIIQA